MLVVRHACVFIGQGPFCGITFPTYDVSLILSQVTQKMLQDLKYYSMLDVVSLIPKQGLYLFEFLKKILFFSSQIPFSSNPRLYFEIWIRSKTLERR